MVYFGVDLYRFSLICNDCFRKVVYKKEKGDEQIVLTPSISESNIKFLKISSLFPPRRVLYRAELQPELRVQMYGFILK